MSAQTPHGEVLQIHDSQSAELVKDIKSKLKNGAVSEASLSTDEKVLARVTDGIYRQPSSAIRELISNAYDADAENVVIDTDAPRFENIVVRDDGNGMSIEVLANLIHHIGGSAKRSSRQPELEVVDRNNPNLSPKKNRKVIGKIGIGLFSVAQLTREFSIITKRADTDYYVIADVLLNNYSEQQLSEYEKRGEGFHTGHVKIRTEPTENIAAHGTDIILKNIKKSARDQLQSVDIWLQETDVDLSTNAQASLPVHLPAFHIGCTYSNNNQLVFKNPVIPWDISDQPNIRFQKLYEAMISRAAVTVSPKIELDFDNYLNMLWTLALSAPVEYIDKHPFALTGKEYPTANKINNSPKGKVDIVTLEKNETIKDRFNLATPTTLPDFQVIIDGVQLLRPIKFTGLPSTTAAVKEPILFIGSARPDTTKFDPSISGGELAFEAYILWSPKIVPKEHNGVIIRINNASGVLFDPSFMKYQVAEHVIKGQLTIEIFMKEGLDSALNIDRESFNIAHPHYQIVMRWLHSALRQVIAKYKEIRKEKLTERKTGKTYEFTERLFAEVCNTARSLQKEVDDIRPVQLLKEGDIPIVGAYKIKKEDLEEWLSSRFPNPDAGNVVIEKTKAIIQILDSFDLIDDLPSDKQKELFKSIAKVNNLEG